MDAALRRRLDALIVICAAILAYLVSSALYRDAVFFSIGWLVFTVGIAKAADWYVQFSVLWETTEPAESEP